MSQISHTEGNALHTQRSTYSHSKAITHHQGRFVSVRFVVLTKRVGPFITVNGDTVYFQHTVLQHIQPQSALLNLWLQDWWFVVYDLWFFGLGKQTYPACVNISARKKQNNTKKRVCSTLMGFSEATNLYKSWNSHLTLYSLEWTLECHQQTNLPWDGSTVDITTQWAFWATKLKVWSSCSTVVHTFKLQILGWTKMLHLNQLSMQMPEKLPVFSQHGLWTISGLITTQFDWGLKKTSIVLCWRLYLTFQRAHDLPNYRAFFFPGCSETTCRTWAGESVSSTFLCSVFCGCPHKCQTVFICYFI